MESSLHTFEDITIRPLESDKEYLDSALLQEETWGNGFDDLVPPSLMKVNQKVGGITAGAFSKENELLGFVFGLTGIMDNELVHWSHLLAVRPVFRKHGIGRKLKLYQRRVLLDQGIKKMYWTFEPLLARNAHLNLQRLGATVSKYVPNMYLETGSLLHQVIGMDRFIVLWQLDDPRVEVIITSSDSSKEKRFDTVPVVNTITRGSETFLPIDFAFPTEKQFRVEIPRDITHLQQENPEQAKLWRHNTRRIFLWSQDNGYTISSFYIDKKTERAFYVLEQSVQKE